jgi:hypothetical protein
MIMFFKKAVFLIFLGFLLSTAFLSAQESTAQDIENLLNTPAVTYAQAARFILQAADLTPTALGADEAFCDVSMRNWLPKSVKADDAARLDVISLLLMRAFEVDGGFMYSRTGSPHYAYRELTYKNVLQGRTDPAMLVTGERLIFYVTRLLALRGDE